MGNRPPLCTNQKTFNGMGKIEEKLAGMGVDIPEVVASKGKYVHDVLFPTRIDPL